MALFVLLGGSLMACAGLMIAADAGPSPVCEEARRTNGWCKAANAGYVASVEIRSRYLYEALDTHGHRIVRTAVTCETCRKALETDDYCPGHRMGYVGGRAFMSAITYQLARARKIDPATITCPICREHTQEIGWCEKDQVGLAGYFAVSDRKQFAELAQAYAILLEAVETLPKCETCAAAIITNGYCTTHRLWYQSGLPSASPRPGP
jgi:hypothetical protein